MGLSSSQHQASSPAIDWKGDSVSFTRIAGAVILPCKFYWRVFSLMESSKCLLPPLLIQSH